MSADWLDDLGIDKTCRLVGMCRGFITLTKVDDLYTLWFYNYAHAKGTRVQMYRLYATFIFEPNIARLYNG